MHGVAGAVYRPVGVNIAGPLWLVGGEGPVGEGIDREILTAAADDANVVGARLFHG